jgi:hypothetical protein
VLARARPRCRTIRADRSSAERPASQSIPSAASAPRTSGRNPRCPSPHPHSPMHGPGSPGRFSVRPRPRCNRQLHCTRSRSSRRISGRHAGDGASTMPPRPMVMRLTTGSRWLVFFSKGLRLPAPSRFCLEMFRLAPFPLIVRGLEAKKKTNTPWLTSPSRGAAPGAQGVCTRVSTAADRCMSRGSLRWRAGCSSAASIRAPGALPRGAAHRAWRAPHAPPSRAPARAGPCSRTAALSFWPCCGQRLPRPTSRGATALGAPARATARCPAGASPQAFIATLRAKTPRRCAAPAAARRRGFRATAPRKLRAPSGISVLAPTRGLSAQPGHGARRGAS